MKYLASLPLLLLASSPLVGLVASVSLPPTAGAAPAKTRVLRVSVAPAVLGPRTKGRITYGLSRASAVSVRLQRQENGRITSARTGCRASRASNRRGKPCTFFGSTVARRTARGKAGANRIAISRRFAGKTLRSGVYRVTVRATSGSLRQAVFVVRSR